MNSIFQDVPKKINFIVYNPLNVKFNHDNLILQPCKLKQTKLFNKLKSYTWSSNCRFFFIVNKDNIIVANTMNNDGFISNLTWKLFEKYLKISSQKKR